MEAPFELDEEQKQIKQKIFPYLKALTYELIKTQPVQLEKFMIDFLTKQGNYTTSGLTKNEKKELEALRLAVKHYRELEQHNLAGSNSKREITEIKVDAPVDSESSYSDENEDVMDEKEEEEINNKLNNIRRTQESQNSIKARVSVSAEAYGLYNKKGNFVPKVIPKNEDQMNRIKGKIISSFIFSSLEKKDLDVVINAMEEKRFKLNENVITQGDDGDCLYIVETGSLKCFKTFNPENSPKFLKNYEPGESFGELALLYNCPRAATIVCSSDECILWSLDRETFNNIVKDAAQKKREKYENFLKNVDILSTIDSYELGQICDSLKDGIYKKDEYIIREGELGDVFYIIEEGQCIATKTLEPGKPEVKINEMKEGDYFGERALLKGEPRYANIVVTSEIAKVISLDRLSFNRLLGPIIDILKRNIDKYQVYCVNNSTANEKENNISDNNGSNDNINHNNTNLNKLDNILTSDNNINLNNQEYSNNPINIDTNKEINDNSNNENNNEVQNSYTNIDPNNNLNNILTSDINNNNNNDIIDIIEDNKDSYKQEVNIDNNKNDNDIIEDNKDSYKQEENTDNNKNENENEVNNNVDTNNNNLTSLQDVLISNSEGQKENHNDTNNIGENEEKQENTEENNENNNNEPAEIITTPNENKENEENQEGELNSLKDMLEYKGDEN